MNRAVPSPVAIVGLGYVGVQLATRFGRLFPTVGYDIDAERIQELRDGLDRQGEVTPETLQATTHLVLADDPEELASAAVCIVAVPTPVDAARRPELRPLIDASRLVGRAWRHRVQTHADRPPIVVFESTVYPGCTEEICVPILEAESGLQRGRDFKLGYSPERINPGDPDHRLENVVKIVAAEDAETTDLLAALYGLIVRAGVYKAPDIRTAEAAKVIENVQRDLNIALMNELAVLFHRLGLDTGAVLAAAQTKWNFLPFEPGLVGGHCIPVDPYYLTHKAQEVGFHPQVVLAGRRTNDAMGQYVARQTLRLLNRAGRVVRDARVLVLGVAFKENVRDVRNTRVAELIQELRDHDVEPVVHDPLVPRDDITRLGFRFVDEPFAGQQFDAVILAVPHHSFRVRPVQEFLRLLDSANGPGVLIDVKGALALSSAERENVLYWRL